MDKDYLPLSPEVWFCMKLMDISIDCTGICEAFFRSPPRINTGNVLKVGHVSVFLLRSLFTLFSMVIFYYNLLLLSLGYSLSSKGSCAGSLSPVLRWWNH